MRVCRKLLMSDFYHGNFRHGWQASDGDIFGQLCLSMPHKSGCLGSFLIFPLGSATPTIHLVEPPLRGLKNKEEGEKALTLGKENMGNCLTYCLTEMRIQATNMIIIHTDFTFFPNPVNKK